jgi:hypothetical protein
MMRRTTMQALSRVRKVVGYLATDRWLVVSALLLVSATRFALCILRVRRAARLLGWLVPGRPGKPPDPSLADRVVRAVMRASRVVPGATCLTQALAAQVLLERHRRPTRLHIGVFRDGRQQVVRGHAWVESEGKVVVGGHDLSTYVPLASLEGRARDAAMPASGGTWRGR